MATRVENEQNKQRESKCQGIGSGITHTRQRNKVCMHSPRGDDAQPLSRSHTKAQQGVAVDNSKRFDLWHWPSVCLTQRPNRLSVSPSPSLSHYIFYSMSQGQTESRCWNNQTWHHNMHTPILSSSLVISHLLSWISRDLYRTQWRMMQLNLDLTQCNPINLSLIIHVILYLRGSCCNYCVGLMFTGDAVVFTAAPGIHTGVS